MNKLDRVLDRDDVPAEIRIYVIDHRRERGRFAAAGRAGDNDEAFVQVTEFLQRLGQLEFVERKNLCGDLPENGGLAPMIIKKVAAESRDAGNFVGEIEIFTLEKFVPTTFGHDFLEE